MREPKTDRNAAIHLDFKNGMKYDQLAAKYTISRSRVITIVKRIEKNRIGYTVRHGVAYPIQKRSKNP